MLNIRDEFEFIYKIVMGRLSAAQQFEMWEANNNWCIFIGLKMKIFYHFVKFYLYSYWKMSITFEYFLNIYL